MAVVEGSETRDPLTEQARAAGPISPGGFRAVVIEPRLRTSYHDFGDLAEARAYANDAASEVDGPPVAVVLDADFRILHRGRAYYLRPVTLRSAPP